MTNQPHDDQFTDLDFEDVTATEFGSDATDIDLTATDESFGDFANETTSEPTASKSPDDASAKKKRMLVFYALVGAVLLAGGGFAAYSFLGKGASTPQPEVTEQQIANDTNAPTPTADTAATLTADATGIAPQQPDMDQLIGDTTGTGAPAPTDPANENVSLLDNPEIATQALPENTASTTTETPTSQTAAPDSYSDKDVGNDNVFDALSAQPTAVEAVTPPTQQTAIPDAQTPSTPTTLDANNFNAPIVAETQTITPAASNDPLAQMVQPETTTAPEPKITEQVDTTKINALESKVSDLEKTIENLNAQLNAAQDRLEKAETKTDVSALTNEPVKAKSSIANKPSKKTVKKIATPKPTDADAPYNNGGVYRAATRQTNSNIELRGISGNTATLAINGQIRQVKIGETVEGLGRVTSIERGSQGWIVQGTKARAVQ